jgi:Tol biopolymer transport system component
MEGAPVWGAGNVILFSQYRDGIFRVSAEGGAPTRVTVIDKTKRELNHYWPTFLPDGRHFLYMTTALGADGSRTTPSVYIASLDSPGVRLLARMHSRMTYAPPGHLLFVQDGALFAQAFDMAKLGLTGEPIQVADGIGYVRTLGNGAFSVSDNGVLAYLGSDDAASLVWYDRLGRASDPAWGAQNFGTIRISPDTQRVAVEVVDRRTGTGDIWIYDIARGVPVRFTTEVTNQSQPIWSPDGGRVLFRWERVGSPDIYAKAIGTGTEELLVGDPEPLSPEDFSADGRWMAYNKNTRQTGRDIWLMAMTGDRTPRVFSATQFEEASARFSPDSRSIAFVSTESGPPQVYVAPVLEPGNRKRISIGGGTAPRWRGDGRELFYTTPDGRTVMSVAIEAGPSFKMGLPTRLFSVSPSISHDRGRNVAYDVWPDGQRFLVGVPAGAPSTSRITVVLNWQAALAR